MDIRGTARTIEQIKAETSTPQRQVRRQWLFRFWAVLMRTTPPLGPVRGLVAQGEVEGRPFDATALAETFGIPRTTINWAIQQLVTAGEVRRERDGRRIALYLTEQGWRELDRSWSDINRMLDEFLDLSGPRSHR